MSYFVHVPLNGWCSCFHPIKIFVGQWTRSGLLVSPDNSAATSILESIILNFLFPFCIIQIYTYIYIHIYMCMCTMWWSLFLRFLIWDVRGRWGAGKTYILLLAVSTFSYLFILLFFFFSLLDAPPVFLSCMYINAHTRWCLLTRLWNINSRIREDRFINCF